MKKLLFTLLGFCLAASLPAQGPADHPPTTRRTAAELAELLGPIALYPDALVALILPASTAPSDIVLGARYVASGGNPSRVEDKSWESSVKALTRYPDTLKWLDENLEWTAQVGDAFIEQPVEVMESIQQLRAKARALGNLVDTPQQRIIMDDSDIRIIPAHPEYIYVPRYDPEVIYYERPLSGSLLFFGVGFGIGSWLNYDCDWRHHRLYRGDWHEGWDYGRDRNRRDREDYLYINNNLTNSRVWQPDPVRHRSQSRLATVDRASNDGKTQSRVESRDTVTSEPRDHHKGIARPRPMVGAPARSETVRRADQHDGGKAANEPPSRKMDENKLGEGSKGRVTTPKSIAPGIAGDNKRKSDARDQADRKKPGSEPASVTRSAEAPPKKRSDARAQADMPPPKPRSTRTDEPRSKDAPKHEDTKGKDVPKHEEAKKRPEPTRHEEAKPNAESAKKKDEEKDKDKKKG